MIIYSVLAFSCSLLYSVSSVLCKYGLQQKINLRSLNLKELAAYLARNRIWLLGVLLATVANVAMIQIQSRLDVSVVYSILNFSYVFVLVLGHYFLHEKLNPEQWTAIAVVVVGTLLILTVDQATTGQPTDIGNILDLTAGSMSLVALLIVIPWRYRNLNYELFYASCTGICFGCVETYLKATTNMVAAETGSFSIFSVQDIVDFLSVWPFFVMFFYGAAGWIFLQVTYSHGNVSITIPLVAVTQRLVSMFSGYYVYGEHFGVVKLLGVITIVLGILMLVVSTLRIREPNPA